MRYILAIDSGNTRIKWGIFADEELIANNNVLLADINLLRSAFEQLPAPNEVIISHVTNASIKSEIINIISIWHSPVYWISASAYQCGVRNGYVKPHQLGSDRWAVIIAAWNICQESCLVINVGTAMTIDAISCSGEHLGGLILPSAYLMTKCLSQNTQLQETTGTFFDFPSNTQDAIYSGTIQGLLGAIDRMYDLMINRAGESNRCKCILSGGGAHVIIPYLQYPYEFVDTLVLKGLLLIAKEIRNKPSLMV